MLYFHTIFLLFSFSIAQPSELNQKEVEIGSIEGVISNEHGHPISNALIYLNKENKLIKVATSDTLGLYKFPSVKPNSYTLNISYVGYFKKEIKDVIVGDGKKEVDITMKELRCKHGHAH